LRDVTGYEIGYLLLTPDPISTQLRWCEGYRTELFIVVDLKVYGYLSEKTGEGGECLKRSPEYWPQAGLRRWQPFWEGTSNPVRGEGKDQKVKERRMKPIESVSMGTFGGT